MAMKHQGLNANNWDTDHEAMNKLSSLMLRDVNAVTVNNDFLLMDPQNIPQKYFTISNFDLLSSKLAPTKGGYYWKHSGREPAWGMWDHGRFIGLKRTYAFHKEVQRGRDKRTNWMMNVYFSIDVNNNVTNGLSLCYVFQHNKYDPCPDSLPVFNIEVKPFMLDVEAMVDNLDSSIEHENDPTIAGPCMATITKRSAVWDYVTEISACRPCGDAIQFAICNHCCQVYKCSDVGTTPLHQHSCRCRCINRVEKGKELEN
ncbi:unnamed protein product [Urochloa humidicola]